MSIEVHAFWQRFLDASPAVGPKTDYQVWHFGDTPTMAAELAELVISGKKTATASLASVNDIKPAEAPVLNGFSVVTDHSGRPLCVIQTIEIIQTPFDRVDASFAFDEGEGDQTLAYWRDVHRDYFGREADRHGLEFNEQSPICCERFRLLFPKRHGR